VSFVEPRDVADDAESEHVIPSARKAYLAERHAVFGRPSLRVDGGGNIPHAVPRGILLAVVERIEVALHSLWIHCELVARAPVVIRVDHDLHAIGWRGNVAATEIRTDAIGVGIEAADEHVQIPVVVRDLYGGAEGRSRAARRRELLELRDGGSAAPNRVVILAVERGWRRRAHGDCAPHCRRVSRAGGNPGGRERLRRESDGSERREYRQREWQANPCWCVRGYLGGSGSAIVAVILRR